MKIHFNFKLILISLVYCIPSILSTINGRCTGRNGICISIVNCRNYGGESFTGKCPNDANNIRCCDNISCKADDGREGSCMFTNQCNGEGISGKCPGASDFKCSVQKKECSYDGLNGIWKDVNQCTGFRVSGLCPGGSNNQCCLPKNTCSDGTSNGQCIPVNQCSTGYTVSGKCPGGSSIKCCLPKPPNSSNNPSTTSNVSEFKKAFGSIISEYARKNNIDENVLGAFILVESSGSGFANGKLKIRFENHIFLKNDAAKYKDK